MADNQTTDDKKGDEKKDIDFIPKKDYEELNSRYSRIEKLNQDLIAEREANSAKLSSFEQELQKYKSENKGNKVKGAKTPEEIQALIDESIGEVKSQFTTQIEALTNEKTTYEKQLKELTVVSKIGDLAQGRINKDMMPFLKNQAMQELAIDPSNPDKIMVIDPKTGNKRLSQKNAGEAMTAQEWMEGLEANYPSMFAPKQVTTGTMGNGQNKMSPTDAAKGFNGTKEEWLKVRNTYPMGDRLKIDKQLGF